MQIPPPHQITKIITNENFNEVTEVDIIAKQLMKWVLVNDNKRAVVLATVEVDDDNRAKNVGFIGGQGNNIMHVLEGACKNDSDFERLLINAAKHIVLDKILEKKVKI